MAECSGGTHAYVTTIATVHLIIYTGTDNNVIMLTIIMCGYIFNSEQPLQFTHLVLNLHSNSSCWTTRRPACTVKRNVFNTTHSVIPKV